MVHWEKSNHPSNFSTTPLNNRNNRLASLRTSLSQSFTACLHLWTSTKSQQSTLQLSLTALSSNLNAMTRTIFLSTCISISSTEILVKSLKVFVQVSTPTPVRHTLICLMIRCMASPKSREDATFATTWSLVFSSLVWQWSVHLLFCFTTILT